MGMDADRVRAYLQVACAGLGFDIGEVWWMSNESGTSTVAAIEDRETRVETTTAANFVGAGNEIKISSTSIPSSTVTATTTTVTKRVMPKKRFLQLYTSKAYNNQRSKLVQPRAEASSVDDGGGGDDDGATIFSSDINANDRGGCNTYPDNDLSSIPKHTAPLPSSQRCTNTDHSLELEREHVLSPKIVEAVTHSTQVVWANCQRSEGLLGRSDVRLQTAIGMPVGVDEVGNVWVVVMFSPMNVESSNDAIDYLKYISRSAATTGIPCLLPVWGSAEMMTTTVAPEMDKGRGRMKSTASKTSNYIYNGNDIIRIQDNEDPDAENEENSHQDQHRSLTLITPRKNLLDHTEELGEGVIAKFVSFNVNDVDEVEENDHVNDHSYLMAEIEKESNPIFDNDLRNAPKDAWGIPILPSEIDAGRQMSTMTYISDDLDIIDDAITDAFDEASYGVWSTIMNSSGIPSTPMMEPTVEVDCTGRRIAASMPTFSSSAIHGSSCNSNNAAISVTQLELIQGRLEEFAIAFCGMSVFDVADVWTMAPSWNKVDSLYAGVNGDGDMESNRSMHLKCLFSVAATNTNPEINVLRGESMNASIDIADGAVGRAYSSGCSVWSSIKEIIYDCGRQPALENCKIETAFAIPVSSSGDAPPSCILCFYSLIPMESVPFVMKFVQKAVRLLWDGLDRVVDPHESVGRELWKGVGPADLGEMAADVEMQKAFAGKKRPRGVSFKVEHERNNRNYQDLSKSAQKTSESGLLLDLVDDTLFCPPVPSKGLAPAPQLPRIVQECSPNALQYIYFNSATEGHWAVQQAVQSVRDVQLWNGTLGTENRGIQLFGHNFDANMVHKQPQPPTELLRKQLENHEGQYLQSLQYEMAPIDQQEPHRISITRPPAEAHACDPALIHANLIEFNAMAQLYANNHLNSNIQSTHVPLINYHDMLKSISDEPIREYYGGSNVHPTPRIIHATNDTTFHVTNGSSASAGLLETMHCATLTHQLCRQPTDQSLLGVDQKACRIEGCTEITVAKRPYCARHCGNRQCERDGCNKCAQGATRFCIAHGGGRRCTFPGCDKGARDKHFCAAHGGGKRCKTDGCNKSAVGGSLFCTGHGGGKRCRVPGCIKSAQSSTEFCVKHGGGKKCQHEGCEKVARGKTLYCAAHGGGIRCKIDGCNRVAIGKLQLCRSHGGGTDTHFIAVSM